MQNEPGLSFKLWSARDWCPLFLEFRAGFLILPTHAQSLPNSIITSCLLYKCCQDSTGQILKVWWFLKFIPTWTLLKRNPQQGTKPTLGLHSSEALGYPLILYATLSSCIWARGLWLKDFFPPALSFDTLTLSFNVSYKIFCSQILSCLFTRRYWPGTLHFTSFYPNYCCVVIA